MSRRKDERMHEEAMRLITEQMEQATRRFELDPSSGKFREVPSGPIIVKEPALIRVVEGNRTREHFDDEVRSFSNAKSSTSSTETIEVSYTTRITASVDLSRSRALSAQAGVKFHNIASAQAGLRAELTRHYSVTVEGELTFKQTTSVNIPAHKNVNVVLHWWRTWAHGTITIGDLANPGVEVAQAPFSATVALAFDKDAHDVR